MPADRRTLREHAEAWLANRQLKPRTRTEYRKVLDAWILPTLGNEPVADIAPETIRAWYAACAPGRDATRAKAYGVLRAIMAQLEDDGTIARNPVRIKGGSAHKTAKRVRILTPEELATLAAAMPERLRLAVVLGSYGGLRLGEATGLKRRDIDTGARMVIVRRTAVSVLGQGAREGTPKSAAGFREVALPEAVWPLIEAHLERHTADDPDAWLFPAARRADRPIASATFYLHWHRAREAAGLPSVPFHDLRHTGATMYAQAGATVADVMRRVGHSTPAMALHYMHSDGQRDAQIAGALPVVLPANVVPLKPKRRTKGKSA